MLYPTLEVAKLLRNPLRVQHVYWTCWTLGAWDSCARVEVLNAVHALGVVRRWPVCLSLSFLGRLPCDSKTLALADQIDQVDQIDQTDQIYQIDHDLDHLDPSLPL